MSTISESLTTLQIKNNFVIDIDESYLNKSNKNAAYKMSLTCKKCQEKKEYACKSVKENSFIKCNCYNTTTIKRAQFKDLIVLNTTESVVEETNNTIEQIIESDSKILDLSNCLFQKFIQDNDMLTFKCCKQLYIQSSAKLNTLQMNCPFNCKIENKKIPININQYKADIGKRLNELLYTEKNELLFKKYVSCSIILVRFIDDKLNNNDINEIFENPYLYIEELFDEQQVFFISDLISINKDQDISDLYKETLELANKLIEINNKQKHLQYLYESKEHNDEYNTKKNKSKFIELISNLDFDLDLYKSNTIESIIEYKKNNKNLQVIEYNDTETEITCKCEKCDSQFVSTKQAFELLAKSSSMCSYCHPLAKAEDYKKINDYDFITYSYLNRGVYSAADLDLINN